MKYFFTFLFLSLFTSFAQNVNHHLFEKKGEVYFSFTVDGAKTLNSLSSIISIDNVNANTVYAYANEQEFDKFLDYNITYKILPHPGDAVVEVSADPQSVRAWDVYPTYDAYIQMMNSFQNTYPSLCKIVETGTTPGGRKLLFAKLTKDVNVKGPKPQFMFASSMHGDETTGYVLMLRLIDSLLVSYRNNPRISRLLDSVEIWIQPLSNPDGTYYGGNGTVTGARRYNLNNVDLNRNFPDPATGPNPTGTWQPETVTMMNLETVNNFVLSANFHGGAEVFNYPWDCWSRLAPDNTWYRFIGRQFVDTVHKFSPSTYMDDLENGITNGYAWYYVYGGRQDYMTYFQRGREITIEISNTKLLSGSLLPTHWNYLKNSFLNFMENVYYGIRGKVTDTYGNPLKANVSIQGLAFDHGDVKSDSITGMYYRMIAPGTYTVTVSADSFISKTITGVTASNYNATYLNIQLEPTNPTPVELLSFNVIDQNTSVMLNWSTSTEKNNKGFELQRRYSRDKEFKVVSFINGYGTTTERKDYSFEDNLSLAGKYYYRLYQVDFNGTKTLVGEAETNSSPSEFTLSQNYPNPFNPSTSINFTIPVAGNVLLKLYDILGNEIRTLVNENKEEGSYTYLLNASELPSGMYIYKITAGNYTSSRKLMLLK